MKLRIREMAFGAFFSFTMLIPIVGFAQVWEEVNTESNTPGQWNEVTCTDGFGWQVCEKPAPAWVCKYDAGNMVTKGMGYCQGSPSWNNTSYFVNGALVLSGIGATSPDYQIGAYRGYTTQSCRGSTERKYQYEICTKN